MTSYTSSHARRILFLLNNLLFFFNLFLSIYITLSRFLLVSIYLSLSVSIFLNLYPSLTPLIYVASLNYHFPAQLRCVQRQYFSLLVPPPRLFFPLLQPLFFLFFLSIYSYPFLFFFSAPCFCIPHSGANGLITLFLIFPSVGCLSRCHSRFATAACSGLSV